MSKVMKVGELSGREVGKVITVSPQPGLTITDTLRSVVHGEDRGEFADSAPRVRVALVNLAPRKAFEFTTDAFTFDAEDNVEVQD